MPLIAGWVGHAGSVSTMPLDALTAQIHELKYRDEEPWLHSHFLRLSDRHLTIELDIRVNGRCIAVGSLNATMSWSIDSLWDSTST